MRKAALMDALAGIMVMASHGTWKECMFCYSGIVNLLDLHLSPRAINLEDTAFDLQRQKCF
jgi:hypothetical protein